MLLRSTGNEDRFDERFREINETTCQVLGVTLKTPKHQH